VCGDNSNVAYVDPVMGTDNAMCTVTLPCDTIDAALMTKRPYIKLTGAIDEAVVVTMQTTVTFLADPGTTLTGAGVVVTVTQASDVSIFDLKIIGTNEKG